MGKNQKIWVSLYYPFVGGPFFNLEYFGKYIYNIKFTILTILGVQFNGSKYSHTLVQPSISRTLFMLQNWDLVPIKQ